MRYLVSVCGAILLGALLGGLIGFAIQQAVGQEGWALVGGAAGANAGAFWAALRRAAGQPFWRTPTRSRTTSETPSAPAG